MGPLLILFLLPFLFLALCLALGVPLLVFLVAALPFVRRIPFAYNLKSLAARRTTTAASGLGIAAVVFVLALALMLTDGIKRTLGDTGSADSAIVIRKGSDAEMASSIEEPQIGLILAGPGVKKNARSEPLGVAELVVVATMEKIGEKGGLSNVQIRGVPQNVFEFRPGARIVAGRPLRPGSDEVVVGKRIRGRFAGVELGQSFELRKNRPVTVVGVMEDGGSSTESEVWADRDTLRAAFGREGLVSSVRVRLASPALYDAFEAYVERDKQLGLEALREKDYFEKQSQFTSLFVTAFGVIIAFLFSIAAMIGAMITMYGSVADRTREIGTLRALGFSRTGILCSFLLESVLLSLAGAAVGLAAALAMGSVKISMINFQTWSEMVFSLTPTARSLLVAVLGAALMGLTGGFLPAVRAARVSAIQAMRG